MQISKNPHIETAESVIQQLGTRVSGLSMEEVNRRTEKFGKNQIPDVKKISPFLILLKQFKNWLVVILIIAAIISAIAGQTIDTWVIIAVVIINASIGFWQEFQAEKAIEGLKKMIVQTAKVIREGEIHEINSIDLVPGDIIVLEEGDSVAADARIIQQKNLRTIESSLTGESLPVSKHADLVSKNAAVADRKNMVWNGTFVVGGYAHAVVNSTGLSTEIGNISQSLAGIEIARTEFLKKTDILGQQMAIIAICSATLIFLVGYFVRDFEINEILLTSIAALVAAVPEGLPAVISIVLAIGAQRMAKRNAIIRDFTATETLGNVTAILTDKTGTLTQNKLTVKKVFLSAKREYDVSGEGWFPVGNFRKGDIIIDPSTDDCLKTLLSVAELSNNSQLKYNDEGDSYELIGDPTEGALLVLAKKGSVGSSADPDNKIDDLPFSSELKLRATLTQNQTAKKLYVTGAPENLLEKSTKILTDDGIKELSTEQTKIIQDKISSWSNKAMRVIALATKDCQYDSINEDDIDDLTFIGIVGMIDPPRPDARIAVEKCKNAGIKVVMVTGDHVNTAVAIARSCGIIDPKDSADVSALTEQQLLALNEDDFERAISTVPVFARLSPDMKLKIAEALQSKGQLIAMTGDGVNDAPALRKADVGISMGIMGTDVARDTSDVVLADDNFASIVNAVEEGRIVFKNARQTSFYLITTNIAESVTLLLAIAIGLPLPLTATQILWLNLITDGITTVALATESGHGNIMNARPLVKGENILNKKVIPFLLINVVLMVGLSMYVFFDDLEISEEKARTSVFFVMSFTQLFNVFNMRSLELSAFKIGLFSNKYINLSILIAVILLVIVTEVPIIANIFHFQPVNIQEFFYLLLISSSVLWAAEIFKAVRR